MARYIVIRLLWIIVVFLLLFVIIYFAASLAHLAFWQRSLPFREQLQISYEGFITFLDDLFFGTLEQEGRRETVMETFRKTAPVSLSIVGVGFLFTLAAGLFLGVMSAVYKNSFLDYVISTITLFFASIPAYLWVIGLMVMFAWTLGWLPGMYPVYAADMGTPPIDVQIIGMIIPVIALSFYPVATFAQLIRGEVIEQNTSDALLLAKAKGLSMRRALFKHSLPLSFLPILREIPNMFIFMLFNAFLVEVAYNVPGIARWFYHSVYMNVMDSGTFNIDPPVVVIVSLFYAALMLIMTLIVDLSYGLIDPRINMQGKK